MRLLALASAAALLAGCAAPPAQRPPPGAAARGAPVPAEVVTAAGAAAGVDVWAITGPCPAAGTPSWRDDLAVLLWVQEARTPEEVQRAAAEVELGPEALADGAGGPLDAAHRPLTWALLAAAERDARKVYGPLKAHCGRPRPYAADPRVVPAVQREPSPAFPSGHATRGALYARLLAELAPSRAPALLERGRQIGFDRVRAGVHWPSDVEAGRKLGTALAEAWLARPEFRARLEEARRAEWR
ncbi:phosphatase PAP2 family protein [Anaeromyxobacter diazotrophicus]|nr:phosphatase PAP2 family protein [Anaeromyxobacter diazotrophicus]